MERDLSRTNKALTRALACKGDVRRAKRFLNRIIAGVRNANGRHGKHTATMRNQTRRIVLRQIAKP